MKRTLATSALVISTALCLPAYGQQAPASPNVPNPSQPPTSMEGAPGGRNAPAATDMNSGTGTSTATDQKMHKAPSKQSGTTARHKKPREQGTPPAPTAEAPSGPKGDSPNPLPKQ
ncbi:MULTISPECIES: hypothetical protein [Cupriavidus]|uniref:Uncharacterized protein n=1 Tax=Cupriavidus pinatubonensis (strain JMP 134 / LMG 1197) TaxID=264198 RepID=Q46TF6_CUPPJ|nr:MULTISPECIES: hypothetical protein [Cupriavidus]QYY28703.1 hypothetical protein K2O51_00265 [Cupriavidus pinatubonensis]TPQ34456.1 hypothetical protein C2U69_22690 [Cupriavidus pinatubonensis]